MSEKTATQLRYEASVKDMAKQRFWEHPKTLPEAIAKHYCAHAMAALQLAEIINLRDRVSDTTAPDAIIEQICERIKEDHARTFGTELIDTVSPKAKAWARYIEELDGVE